MDDFVSVWMRQPAALEVLQISRSTFLRLRRQGIFRPVVHFVRATRSRRAPLIINVAACRLAQAVHLGH